MLKSRAGFTLGEVLVALVMTGVIGAAVTGVFISQSQFFDTQEKAGAARAVTRGAVAMLMSELRMIERGGGVITANDTLLRVRVPYRMGLACRVNAVGVWVTFLPADPSVAANAVYGGYAFRDPASGAYTYMEGGNVPESVGGAVAASCAGQGYAVVANGVEQRVRPTSGVTLGSPVFVYQIVEYVFRPSVAVPGTVALWREVIGSNTDEELVAPFDTTVGFRYYANDAANPAAAPADLTTITGVELRLDGISERDNRDGSTRSVPFSTSVFFRNRM